MQKLKTFFRTFAKSITSPNYYKDIVKTRFSFSLKYFLFFSFLLAILATAVFGYFVTTELPPIIDRSQDYAQNFYPEDLVFELKSGKLTINRPEPFAIPLPAEILTDKPVAIPDSQRLNLFVYDSKAKLVDFEDYHTLILANEETIMVQGDDDAGGIRAFPLKNADDATIDKELVGDIISKILPFAQFIVPILITVAFFGILLYLLFSKLISLIFLSSVLLFIGRHVIKLKLSYSKYYQVGLHSATLPTLVQIGLLFFDINIPIPSFLAIFFLLYTLIILSHLREAK